MDLQAIERQMDTLIKELPKAKLRADIRLAKDAIRVVQVASTGIFSSSYLAAINHPYGIGPSNSRGPRGPIPYGDPSIINRQTGVFSRSWTYQVMFGHVIVYNIASYAEYLEKGTSKMIARPVDRFIPQFVERYGFQYLKSEIDSLMRKTLPQ